MNQPVQYVTTIEDRCRVCYTCVRECPAKAIRIQEGQATVVAERCISCGNCVKVCSQGAKQVGSTIVELRRLLAGEQPVAACVAPSFAAEFSEYQADQFPALLRPLGFTYVVDVAFGANLVAREYKRLLADDHESRFVASTCPAVVEYIERYYPEMVDRLAPIVSPMVATARSVRAHYGKEVRCVFIGPCIAKKVEADRPSAPRDIDVAITFAELRHLIGEPAQPELDNNSSGWDPPLPGTGALFPITGGLLQAAEIEEDLLMDETVTADGLIESTEAIREFADGDLNTNLLEVLFCNGCIMGPGMTGDAPLFKRRSCVSRYARQRMDRFDPDAWKQACETVADVQLGRRFAPNDQRLGSPDNDRISQILASMGKHATRDELNCGACGYHSCRDHAEAIEKGLAESEMCLPFVIEEMKHTVNELTVSHRQLASAQQQLMQSEKLASMGQLAAGVAHELNNPLGVVLMYSHLLLDESDPSSETHQDLRMIAEQADRGKKIVANLLDFARENKVFIEPVSIAPFIEKSLASVDVPGNVHIALELEQKIDSCELDRDQMTQVLTNLYTNAFAAMEPSGGRLTVRCTDDDGLLTLRIADTGCGIPFENIDKIFQPFFTTKAIGKGTGLGLAVVYGIIKMHKGQVAVSSNTNAAQGPTGTQFKITLPLTGGLS